MKEEKPITILTPTFNRGSQLINLYQSIKDQTTKGFEWLIVDDGSIDDTKQIVEKWIAEEDIVIRYIYKENGGKHTALNMGIKTINSELTFIVDSDDMLALDAVETILRYHERYWGEENLCGYVFLRKFPNGKINGKEFTPNEKIATYIEARINSDDTMADKAEVFYTHCLKEFPFPEYPDEKFLGEDIVWMRMAKKYQMVHINEAIYIGDYLDDGLTLNRRKHNIESPIGCMHRAEEFMCGEIKAKYQVKGILQYIIYGKFAGFKVSTLVSQAPNKGKVILLLIPGILLFKKWRINYLKYKYDYHFDEVKENGDKNNE